MIIKLVNEIIRHIDFFLSYIPGYFGEFLRVLYYKYVFNIKHKIRASIGVEFQSKKSIHFLGDVYIGKNSFFTATYGIMHIGNNTRFNTNVHINSSGGGFISIGDNCLIGPNVVIRTSNHKFDDVNTPIVNQGHVTGRIIIEDDVWLGSNVIILPNVTIGKGSVIGAGSVITKDIPKFAVVVGVPGKVVKYRN